MTIKTYRIGLVVGNLGLNGNQLRVIRDNLKFISKSLEAYGQVLVIVPAMTRKDLERGVSAEFRKLSGIEKVEVTQTTGSCTLKGAVSWLYAELKDCDEVWCCLGEKQDARLVKTVVNQLYLLAQQIGGEQARVFKKIPAWVIPDGPLNSKEK